MTHYGIIVGLRSGAEPSLLARKPLPLCFKVQTSPSLFMEYLRPEAGGIPSKAVEIGGKWCKLRYKV